LRFFEFVGSGVVAVIAGGSWLVVLSVSSVVVGVSRVVSVVVVIVVGGVVAVIAGGYWLVILLVVVGVSCVVSIVVVVVLGVVMNVCLLIFCLFVVLAGCVESMNLDGVDCDGSWWIVFVIIS